MPGSSFSRPRLIAAVDLRPTGLVLGLALSALALAMIVPSIVESANDGMPLALMASSAVTLLFGLALVLANRAGPVRFTIRETVLSMVAVWLVAPAFAALPFIFSDMRLSMAAAYFEATAGLTATNASAISDISALSPGLLLWRGLLQWLGGFGVLMMGVAVMPLLNIGGAQMFRLEDASEGSRALPRAARLAGAVGLLYAGLTLLLAIGLWLAGMTSLDASIHAMTALSTGGFSTHWASIAAYPSHAIEALLLVGMFLGGMPYLLLLRLPRDKGRALWRDDQFRWYVGLIFGVALALGFWVWLMRGLDFGVSFWAALFQTVSAGTSTGYRVTDFSVWGALPATLLFLLMFVGGCSGSTAGGIKVYRFILLYGAARAQILRLLRPHLVYVPTFNGKPITEEVAESVMGFFFVFCLSFAIIAMLLGALGLDFASAATGAASALGNFGPGLGVTLTPTGGHAVLPAAAQWILSLAMIFGRLELLPFLVLFVPRFWKG